MEPFNTPLKIREISLPHRAVFGPMAGFTDAPARRLMAQHGAGFTVSEMVSSRALVYGDHKTVSLLKAEPNGAPYGVQIFGEVPEIMGQAAAAVEQYAFDFLDINMGCPAPKIVSGGAGSKLMLDPDRCGRIVEEVVKNTSRPVTVKMRKGWDAEHVTAVECAKACEQAGAVLIAVHARTGADVHPGHRPVHHCGGEGCRPRSRAGQRRYPHRRGCCADGGGDRLRRRDDCPGCSGRSLAL